jgi:glycerophosphoryl diester phosphodiesterase
MTTSDWLIPRERPLNIGHRGASAAAPQNTLAAFRKAIELGADGVELDAQLSADGVVVVIHDFVVETTTDGVGRVADKTLAELKALDAGSRFSSEFSGERIPTLAQVFEAIKDKLLVNVELKDFDSFGGKLEAPVLEVVRRHAMEKRVLFSSFNPFVLRVIKRLAPDIPAGLLYREDMPIHLRRAWLAPFMPHQARHPHFPMVTEATVQWCHARGLRVNTWTVDEPAEMRRLVALGVDGIITNKPDVLREVLAG